MLSIILPLTHTYILNLAEAVKFGSVYLRAISELNFDNQEAFVGSKLILVIR